MLARVVPSALAAPASAVAPRVALLRVLLAAEAPRPAGLRRTVEERRIEGAAPRTVEVRRIEGATPRTVEVRRIEGAAPRTVEVRRIEGVALRIVEVLRIGAALGIVAVRRVGEALRVVVVHRIRCAAPVEVVPAGPTSIGQLIAPRDAKQVLQCGIHRPDDGRVRMRGPADHALLVRPVHVEVGARRRRPNRSVMLITTNLMLRQTATRSPHHVMVKDVASAAKTGSGFRRRFREPVLRLVVRLRIGFEPDVSLSTAN